MREVHESFVNKRIRIFINIHGVRLLTVRIPAHKPHLSPKKGELKYPGMGIRKK